MNVFLQDGSTQGTMGEQSLTGLRVLVTRARGQSEKLRELLEPLGALVSELPVIEFAPPSDLTDLDHGLTNLDKYDWLILASKNAVDYTLARAGVLDVSLKGPGGPKLAAIGSATAEEMRKKGLKVDYCPSSFVAEFLVEEFPGYPSLDGLKVFLPKTNIGRTLIADRLRSAGATVDTAVAYLTGLPSGHEELAATLVQKLQAQEIDVITLASAQSARNLAKLIEIGISMPGQVTSSLEKLLAPVKIAVIGPVTATAARETLGRADIEAVEYTLAGLTEALLASLKFGQKQ